MRNHEPFTFLSYYPTVHIIQSIAALDVELAVQHHFGTWYLVTWYLLYGLVATLLDICEGRRLYGRAREDL